MSSQKSGGGSRTPYEAPNTLSSAQVIRTIDALCEGPIEGFAYGNDAPFKSVFLSDTPIQNSDGSYNFKGVTGYFNRGSNDQTYIPGFDKTERVVNVGTAVKKTTPITRAVSDPMIDALRVTVGVERNVLVKDNGDTVAAQTQLLVELVRNDGTTLFQSVTFNEKGSGAYYQDVVFDTLPEVPFNVRVSRITADSTSDKISNNTFFASYVETINAKLSYPNTAISALKIDSDQFGSNNPARNFLLKGKNDLLIPTNYDPITRKYTGLWDGGFKTGWTDNPAWILYDLVTNDRYSTIATNLGYADIDKWTLYSVAQWCDELVDDGMGGKEPRCVCNASISDQREAYEVLSSIASMFTGFVLWNGEQLTVTVDKHSEPVAVYTNANVVNGQFSYSFASAKAIHTAVQVTYLDETDTFRQKTEYVADDEAIKQFGLNIKQVTAFGCTRRGQAVRFGAWVLQTELRQQGAVSFTIGREGLKHLPYDVVQVADNDYAGVPFSGRLVAVNADRITLDRAIENVAIGASVYFDGIDGTLTSKVVEQISATELRLEDVLPLEPENTFVIHTQVASRLYRCISITENSDDGTYTIEALRHDPSKYGVVDTWANFPVTVQKETPTVANPDVSTNGGDVVIKWEGLGGDGAVSYDIKVFRNGKLYSHTPDAKTPELRLQNLPDGDYVVEIRARNAAGLLSDPVTKAFSINYTITGLRAIPKLFAVGLVWTLPETVVNTVYTEVWYGIEDNIERASKLATLPHPQSQYTLDNVQLEDEFFFWVRLVDTNGRTGLFTASVVGKCDDDPSLILKQIEGQITESQLHKDLVDQWQSNIDTAVFKEAQERIAGIQQASDAASQALLLTAAAIGNRITVVEEVNAEQTQQITTVTAAQGTTAAGLQSEILARIAGDQAEATARQTLAAQVGNNTSAINASSQTVSDLKTSTATQFTNVNARIDNINPDMLVGITLEAGWVSDTNGTNQTLASHKRTKDYLPVYELVSYVARVTDVTADFNLRVVWYDQNKAFLAGSVVTRFSGAKSFTAPSGAMYVRVSWFTAALKSISFTEVAASAASVVAADLADYKQAQAAVDSAQTLEINAAKSRLGAAEGSITNIQTTYAKKTEVVAMAQTGLQATWQADAQARVDALTIGSRNYLLDSKVGASNKAISTEFDFTKLAVGTVLSISFDIEITAKVSAGARNRIGFEVGVNNAAGGVNYIGGWLTEAASVAVGKQRVSAQYLVSSKCTSNPKALPYYSQTSGGSFTISNVKLEIGSKPTDWLPAPEDTSSALDKSFADISTLQTAVANQTSAMATMNTTLTARIDAAADSGGDNLIDNGNFERGLTAWDNWGTLEVRRAEKRTSGVYQLFLKSSDTSMFKGVSQPVYGILPSQTYTLSFMAARASADGAGMGVQILIHQRGDGNNDPQISNNQLVGVPWQKCTFTFTTSNIAAKDSLNIFLGIRNGQAGTLIIRDVQLEMGSVATAFKPSINGQARKVQAMYSLKVEAFGSRKAMAGIAIGADGETGDAEVLILGNKFMIADPNNGSIKPMLSMAPVNGVNMLAINGNLVADGTILGKHIKASQTLYSPAISGGSMNIGNRFLVDSSGKVTIRENATTNKGLVMTNDSLKIYDEDGVLRVTVGKIS